MSPPPVEPVQPLSSQLAVAARSTPNSTDVCEWAKAKGIDVKDLGRIPTELVIKFKAATGL